MTSRNPDPAHVLSRDLLAARYGRQAAARVPSLGLADLNPVLETLLSHRSVRAFDSRPLVEGTLEWLVAAAQSAASSSNLQTWSVVSVESPERRAALAELVGQQKHVREAPLVLVWLSDLARLQGIAKAAARPIDGAHYLDSWLMAVIDAALAAQNATVAAESLGLGSVYIGSIRNRPEDVGELLGLPAGTFALFGLCVGQPDVARPASVKPRLPLEAVLSRERFVPAEARHVNDYDATMAAFNATQKVNNPPWSTHSTARLAGPSDLKGRHRLREALLAQGLELR